MDKQSHIRRAIATSLKGRFAETHIIALLQRWMDHYASGAESKLTFALLDFLRVEIGDKLDNDSRRLVYQLMIAGVNKSESELAPDLWMDQQSLKPPLAAEEASDEMMRMRQAFGGASVVPTPPAKPAAPVAMPPRAMPVSGSVKTSTANIPSQDKLRARVAAASMAQGKLPEEEAPAPAPVAKKKKGKNDLYGLDADTFQDIFLNHD